ncbi:MAG: thiamine-phosphate kinase [Oligoflexales bacterium]|nr:thiamine-phosphate kinase [Oligoflexales bacterium]
MQEFEFISWLIARQKNLAFQAPELLLGPGDDTAIIEFKQNRKLLYTSDMLLDGVHFKLSEANPQHIGHKCLAVNISDIAAMGGVPCSATISMAIPKNLDPNTLKNIYIGIEATAQRYKISIAGGDTNSWTGPFAISIALLGYSNNEPITRAGAKPGDDIYVTGELGGSIFGKHLTFEPRLKVAQTLTKHFKLNAMIDISDGLLQDLGHIIQASKCGAILDKNAIPISAIALEKSSDKNAALEMALHDGEDFELCFTVDKKDSKKLQEQSKALFPEHKITKIGSIDRGNNVFWSDDIDKTPLKLSGFQHQF